MYVVDMLIQAQEPFQNQPETAKRFYPYRFRLWSKRGLSPRAASALALAGTDTVEQVTALGREWFQGKPNVGVKTLNELARLAGWLDERKTPREAIAAALRLSLPNPDEAEDVAQDIMIALRRHRFAVVTARQSAPADHP
jgi:hypothetical protein